MSTPRAPRLGRRLLFARFDAAAVLLVPAIAMPLD
jgi:hypothetical protein